MVANGRALGNDGIILLSFTDYISQDIWVRWKLCLMTAARYVGHLFLRVNYDSRFADKA